MEAYPINKWSAPALGTVPAYVSNAIPAFEGDYVLSINNPASAYAACGTRFGRFSKAKHSVELAWYKNSDTDYFEVYFYMSEGVQTRGMSIRWQKNQWYYKDSTGNYVAIPDSGDVIFNQTWNWLKVVGDWSTDLHSRLKTLKLDLDLSAIPMRVFTTPAEDWMTFSLIKMTYSINRPLYVDDVRIYLNEV